MRIEIVRLEISQSHNLYSHNLYSQKRHYTEGGIMTLFYLYLQEISKS
jgi:hypothetical protein